MRGQKNGGVSVTLDSGTYALAVVKKAAYKLGDRAFFKIRSKGRTILVQIRPRVSTLQDQGKEQLVGEFLNELIDQDLREQVAQETSGIRDLVMAHAFSRTSLVDPDWESADYLTDAASIRDHSDLIDHKKPG